MPSHRHKVLGNFTGASGTEHTPQLVLKGYDWWDAGTNDSASLTGGDLPHNNMPPYIVQNFIIKVKQSAGLVANVVDNLTSTSTTNALSANQGKVLNEKINTLTTYSTTETKTGETWIDGKPIYKKTYTFTTTSTNDNTTNKNIDVSALEIDNFINVYGSLESVGGTIYSLERCEGENLFTRVQLYNSKTTLQYLTRGQNKYYGGTATMTIRYTKTTD